MESVANKNMTSYLNATAASSPSVSTAGLSKLFDKYRGNLLLIDLCYAELTCADEPKTKPDEIGVSGTMRYLQDLEVAIDDIGMLLVSEFVQSPSMGVITRNGFISGWSSHKYVWAIVSLVSYQF